MKKIYLNLIMILLIISLLLTACQGGGKNPSKNGPQEQGQDKEQGLEDKGGEKEGPIEVTDMAGRRVELPEKLDKIMSTDSVASIILYSLDPDRLVAWNYDLSEGEKQYIDENYHDLPNLGGAGKSPLNLEELLRLNPDMLLYVGEIDDGNIEKMDELEEKINKPVLMLESDMNKLAQSYEFLGEILHLERAKELADYCRKTMEDIEKNSKTIREEDKKTLYYAEGPAGLETEPSNSWHSQVIDLIGGRNVAQVEMTKDKGKSEVNLEQIIEWNPEVIISWADERGGYYSGILEDPAWKDIKAVKDKKVYEIPNRPFNWFDRPPSANRILGIRWLGNILYPDIYDYNMREEVREFFHKFYHYELKEEELDQLLRQNT